MSTDQHVFTSDTPHEVHLPEGSHTAIHKTANAMEPSIRHTEVNPDAEVELVTISQGVSVSQADEIVAGKSNTTTDMPEQMVHAAEEATTDSTAAVPLSIPMSDLPSLELVTSEALQTKGPVVTALAESGDTAAQSSAYEEVPETEAAPLFMEEMNFPARVVKLKIANDKIRHEIDILEKPLFTPIVETAPSAKGKAKGKEEAKKPAKGH
jgi:hypothetical protein